jgi:3-methyladenine DNA glycosylase AlkD
VTRPALRAIADELECELRAAGTQERAVREKAYLKSSLEHAGAPLPAIRASAKRVRRDHPDLDAPAVLALAGELWTVPLHERRMVAVVLLEQYADRLGPGELIRIEPFLRDSHTWALIDGLSGDVAARIVARHPSDALVDSLLRRWAVDVDFWVRRSALLAHLRTLRRGGSFDGWSRFTDIADGMLDEREFFIRKAIGWVLREAGKARPDLVATWLAPRVDRVSGVTLREAVRYLAESDRTSLMQGYSDRISSARGAPSHRRP